MATTTLITFHVRAPNSTTTLQLYGSWDNFSRPYPMQRDTRIGRGHWSGCHKFSNIICDGSPGDRSRSRDGGLKMGGTYWYYYKLNDEIEFHNSAEESTTKCPLLPGQLVNVLQMPFALSGNRSRNPSTSSTSSERRTMNPEDKFISPRPVPAPTKLCRLNTSPTNTEQPGEEVWNDLPLDKKAAKFFKLPRKASLETFNARSSSKERGLRPVFHVRNARSQSPDPLSMRLRSETLSTQSVLQVATARELPKSDNSSISQPDSRPASRPLLLRSHSDESMALMSSFRRHRQQKSISREPSPLRNPQFSDDITPIATKGPMLEKQWPLGTLKEVASAQNTPLWSSEQYTSSPDSKNASLDLEKRLPTLPNTPSSAYPPSFTSPEKGDQDELHNLESHFSATTIDSESYSRIQSLAAQAIEESHFSFDSVPTVPVSGTLTNFEDASPTTENELSDMSEYFSNSYSDQPLPSESSQMTFTTINSTGTNTPASSSYGIENDSFSRTVDRHPSSSISAAMRIQHYTLPEDEYSSAATLKRPQTSDNNNKGNLTVSAQRDYKVQRNDENHLPTDAVVHSESMQRLMDELSYLSGMIQH